MPLHHRTPPESAAGTGVRLMPRVPIFFALLLLGTACAGPRRAPSVQAEPKPSPSTTTPPEAVVIPPPPAHELELDALPPAPALDTLVPAAELAAEVRLAADSAAD